MENLMQSMIANSKKFKELDFCLNYGVQVEKSVLAVLAANVDTPIVLLARAIRKFRDDHQVADLADLVTPSNRMAWDAGELVGKALRHAGQIQGQQPSDDSREVQDGKETIWLVPSLEGSGDIFHKPFSAVVIRTIFRRASSWSSNDIHVITSIALAPDTQA